MPPDAHHVTVLCVVIREDFSQRLVNDVCKVLHELDLLPARVISKNTVAVAGEDNGENEHRVLVAEKSEMETQREITTAWKKFVMEKKMMNGVC